VASRTKFRSPVRAASWTSVSPYRAAGLLFFTDASGQRASSRIGHLNDWILVANRFHPARRNVRGTSLPVVDLFSRAGDVVSPGIGVDADFGPYMSSPRVLSNLAPSKGAFTFDLMFP